MASTLFEILEWTRENGEVRAVDRLGLKIMRIAMTEGLILAAVDKQTECSEEGLVAIRKAASSVVGKPCPD